MDTLDFENRLNNILTHWDKVEESIKAAELLQGYVTVPAINELRYAGRHILRAISLNRQRSNADYEKSLSNAEQYLLNAEHDVVDATVMFVGKRVEELNLRFGKKAISKVYPEYDRLDNVLRQCQRDIALSRRDNTKRLEIYNNIQALYMPQLLSSYKDFYNADLFMAVEHEKLTFALLKQKVETRTWKYGALIGSGAASLFYFIKHFM